MATSSGLPPFKQWRLGPKECRGIDGLQITQDASIGQPRDEEVLVEMHAASLNFMDLFVAKVVSFIPAL